MVNNNLKEVKRKKGKEPLVSIIVPVYNKRPYLVECFDSITGQTWKNLEIIAVDDGSTDGSSNLLKEITKAENRLSVITTKNRGPSAARNTGLDIASGEYVTFVDADDLIESDYIEKMVKNIGEADFCISGRKTWYQRQDRWTEERWLKGSFLRKEYLRWLKNQNESGDGIGWKLYRKAFIDKYDIRFCLETDHAEDSIFFFDVLLHFQSVVCINETGYVIRIHDLNSLMHQPRDKVEKSIVILQDYSRIRSTALEEDLNVIILRRQIEAMLNIGRECCYRMDKMRERKSVFFSIADKFQVKSSYKLGIPRYKNEALVRLTLKIRLFFPFYVATKLFLHSKTELHIINEKSEKQIE